MNWQNFIKQLMIDFRMSGNQLAEKTGITQATINRITNGKTVTPYPVTIKQLEEGLNIKIDDSDENNITYKEVKSNKKTYENIDVKFYQYPLITSVYAGISPGLIVAEQIVDYISLPYKKQENVFAVKVIGDSMNSRIEEGDIILVDSEAEFKNHDIVIVKLRSGEQLIKRYKAIDNRAVMFYSDNAKYEPRICPIADIEVMYKVVKILKDA